MSEHIIHVIGGNDGETIRITDDYDGKICRLVCVVRGETVMADENDFFEAFSTIRRRHMEPKGLIPSCYGASLNVWPSGMARDMGLGRSAYILDTETYPMKLVGIFDTGPGVNPVRVDEQKEYSKVWFNAPRRKVEGYVLTLKCGTCSGEFPYAVFSGDTDMVTMGLLSLTSIERREVAVCEMLGEEMGRGYSEAIAAACERVSRALSRTDLRTVPFIAARTKGPSLAGLPFALFRKAYEPPVVIYACPKCGGEAQSVPEQGWSEFKRSGGRIMPFGLLKLNDPSQFEKPK